MASSIAHVGDARTVAATKSTRPWVRALALTVYTLSLGTWTRGFGIPSDTVQVFIWLWLGTCAWHVEAPPRHHLGFLRDWWAPMAGLTAYFYTRGLADELGLSPEVVMPIEVDRWLGGGSTPTEHLQHALCGTPCDPASDPRWYDLLLTSVYSTHFVVGLSLAAVLWMTSRAEWIRWMRRYVSINMAALVVYVLYPMSPPWLAAEEGFLPADVHRLTSRGWSDAGLDRFHLVLQGVGNPVAAMPSLHAGVAFLIALYAIGRTRSAYRWLFLAYPLVMSLGLVYFGEHYVIDIVAGLLLALVTLVGCRWWESRVSPGSASPTG